MLFIIPRQRVAGLQMSAVPKNEIYWEGQPEKDQREPEAQHRVQAGDGCGQVLL